MSERVKIRVSAPGKMMIAGEYVVLDGAACLVAAVDRRLRASGRDSASDGSAHPSHDSPVEASLPPEALLAREHAERELGAVPMNLSIDARALRSQTAKLGLGSSSAASAAAAGAVLAWHGRDPSLERASILKWALAGHRAVAPEGSGADVAAATLGGLVRFERAAPENATSLAWPEAVHPVVVWTGTPARTSDLVSVVRRFKERSASDYEAVAAELRAAAVSLAGALTDSPDPERAATAADAHGRAMAALGVAAGAPIVTEPLHRVMVLAREHGGGAKPSGAGGGDVALALFVSAADAAAFEAACREEDLTPLSIRLGEDGVRQDRDQE